MDCLHHVHSSSCSRLSSNVWRPPTFPRFRACHAFSFAFLSGALFCRLAFAAFPSHITSQQESFTVEAYTASLESLSKLRLLGAERTPLHVERLASPAATRDAFLGPCAAELSDNITNILRSPELSLSLSRSTTWAGKSLQHLRTRRPLLELPSVPRHLFVEDPNIRAKAIGDPTSLRGA
jgi:hypothetical protein